MCCGVSYAQLMRFFEGMPELFGSKRDKVALVNYACIYVVDKRVGETIGAVGTSAGARTHLSARRECRAGFEATLSATGGGRPGARTNLRPAVRVGHHSPLAAGRCSLGSVLFEQPQLRGLFGLAVSSYNLYNLALPIWRGSSGSARGRLGRLAAVTTQARGAREVGDDGQEAHASAAARASFDLNAKGALEQLSPGAVARAVHALRRRGAGLLIAGRRWGGRSCQRWLGHGRPFEAAASTPE